MKRAVLLTIAVAVLASVCLQASPIAITNAGFEADILALGAFTTSTFASGWVCVNSAFGPGSCGAQHMGASQWTGGVVPDPVNTAYSNGGTISQVLSTALANSTLYTLTVYVGQRLDQSSIGAFPGYTIDLVAGSNIIGFTSSPTPPVGGFSVATVVYQSLASDTNAGQLLGIRLIGNGVQVNFDKVALDGTAVIPEPGTAAFSLIGLALVCVPKMRALLARR